MFRRDFLKLAGGAGAAALSGCDRPSRDLIPYVIAPDDVVPGIATWYATTCRECPAGCGVLAKNRDSRAVKLEGNPNHPINQGALCARGQAALQGLYDPDRVKLPLLKGKDGSFQALSWEKAESLLAAKLKAATNAGEGRIALLTDLVTGTMDTLLTHIMEGLRSDRRLMFEPVSYKPLVEAYKTVYGIEAIPSYRLDEADFIISFGADFLETWLSPVEQARLFAAARRVSNGSMAKAVYVGPRMSVTAANADAWIPTRAGAQGLVALAMLLDAMEKGAAKGLPDSTQMRVREAARRWSFDAIATRTGVAKETIIRLSELFFRARTPLALGHVAGSSEFETVGGYTAIALLNRAAEDAGSLLDFSRQQAIGRCSSARDIVNLLNAMSRGAIDVLVVMGANPLFSLPPSWNIRAALEKVPFTVSLSSYMDETAQAASLVLPVLTPLEVWGDHAPQRGLRGIIQPVMGPVFPHVRPAGDILLAVARKALNPALFPASTFYDYLRDTWRTTLFPSDYPKSFDEFWVEAVKRGFIEEKPKKTGAARVEAGDEKPVASRMDAVHADQLVFPEPQEAAGLHMVAFPHMTLFDGRGANKPWLQELPEGITQITWDSWVEIHPATAEKLGIRHGEKVEVASSSGKIEVAAYVYPGVQKDTIAIPMGRGHQGYGRFADGTVVNRPYYRSVTMPFMEYDRFPVGVNPLVLFPKADESRPDFSLSIQGVTVRGTGAMVGFANTDGSRYEHGRDLAHTLAVHQLASLSQSHVKPPLPEGTRHEDDIYPPHSYEQYRWAMVIDLSKCIGCSACAVACYAENSVATVGPALIREGREMSWLRIERYFDREWRKSPRFLPMLCQHCYNAPCEYVCPVYASHHGAEGLNEQIYNRCVGTRYCSNNCPYKVRRFNWLEYSHPEPLNWQFNPDVVARQKGVMEKCSFCAQRIKDAHIRARNEGRKIRDGEFTTACAQTCPTQAIVFGNVMDKESRVYKLMNDPRAYQALHELNTIPAVIYMKKVVQDIQV